MVEMEWIGVDRMSKQDKDLANKSTILMTMEKSSMASTWQVMLKLTKLGNKNWELSECANEWIGSFYDLIPEDDQFDANGEMRLPDMIDGRRVIGIQDGEWLLGEDIVDGETITFSKETLAKAKSFLQEHEWTLSEHYDDLWSEIIRRVNKEG